MVTVMKTITYAGDAIAVISILVILFAFNKTRHRFAIPVFISVMTSAALNFLLKNIIARPRPAGIMLVNATGYSFPSGHAMVNIALYGMVILLVWKYIENKKLRYIITAVCASLILAIGYSRVYLGVHYTTDVLGGWVIGLVVTVIVYKGWRYFDENKREKSK